MKNLSLVLPLIAALVVAGCVGQTGYTTPGSQEAPKETVVKEGVAARTASVDMKNFEFAQPVVTIKKGDKVMWTQKDSVPHIVTSDTGLFDSPSLKNGETFEYTFTEAGTFTYHCTNHPYMKGKVVVEA